MLPEMQFISPMTATVTIATFIATFLILRMFGGKRRQEASPATVISHRRSTAGRRTEPARPVAQAAPKPQPTLQDWIIWAATGLGLTTDGRAVFVSHKGSNGSVNMGTGENTGPDRHPDGWVVRYCHSGTILRIAQVTASDNLQQIGRTRYKTYLQA